jgi:hypothetical protein
MKRIWIKLWLEILDDAEFGELPEFMKWRAVVLFLAAGENGDDGLLPPVKRLAWRLRLDEVRIAETLSALSQVGVVHETPEGWMVTNFKKRQYSESYERVKRYRNAHSNEKEHDIESIYISPSDSLSLEGGVGGDESKVVEIPKSLDWMIVAGVSSEEIEKTLVKERLSKEITDCWEKSMGYNPLTWSKLERLKRFLITKTPEEIETFAKWSRREYSTFTPAKACQFPDKVIELWPQAFLEETHNNKAEERLERLKNA